MTGPHLLHTEWSNGWGGQEIRILAESQAFIDRGYRVTIACQPDSQLLARAGAAGVPTVELPMHKGADFGAIRRCLRIIRERNVDIVHTHSSVDARWCGIAARIAGVPVVRSRHLSTRIKRSPLSYLLYTRLADRVITSGASIRDAMIHNNRMPPEHIVSIPAGIDQRRFSTERELTDVRASLGIPANAYVIGTVAVLRSWKGHAWLIDAFSELTSVLPHAQLLIVGEGPIRDQLEAQIATSGCAGRIHLVGHQTDVPAYIAAMDCLVLASTRNEATSQVLPQAMAMHKPVISTNVGSLPEVVIDGNTGLLVPPQDADAISAAIRRLHDNPELAAGLAKRGHAHCLARFTFDHMIDATETVYRSVAQRKTRA